MASLCRRRDGRVEIRETRSTERGPRSTTLASFRGALTPDVLEQAAGRARRPFDRARLRERARELGIPVRTQRDDRAARALLAQLRDGTVDPVLVGLLARALADAPAAPVPEPLAEVAEWLGASPAERGRALRGLLRVHDRIARGRPAPRRRRTRFPRFQSRPKAA